MYNSSEKGEGLIEVVVTMFIATIVIGAMAIATIRGVTNATYSQTQIQATKYAQDALENIRSIRDRNLTVTMLSQGQISFSALQELPNACVGSGCYFTLDSTGRVLTEVVSPGQTTLPGGLKRQIILKTSGAAGNKEIRAATIISWTDSSGTHQSNLETILGQIR